MADDRETALNRQISALESAAIQKGWGRQPEFVKYVKDRLNELYRHGLPIPRMIRSYPLSVEFGWGGDNPSVVVEFCLSGAGNRYPGLEVRYIHEPSDVDLDRLLEVLDTSTGPERDPRDIIRRIARDRRWNNQFLSGILNTLDAVYQGDYSDERLGLPDDYVHGEGWLSICFNDGDGDRLATLECRWDPKDRGHKFNVTGVLEYSRVLTSTPEAAGEAVRQRLRQDAGELPMPVQEVERPMFNEVWVVLPGDTDATRAVEVAREGDGQSIIYLLGGMEHAHRVPTASLAHGAEPPSGAALAKAIEEGWK